MSGSMVPRFRVKKLSPKHPLPVFRQSQLPDLDPNYQQRDVPQIETGVEKEEEEEHDLQAAISAAQAAVETGTHIQHSIPTPDASRTIKSEVYQALYPNKYKDPHTYIRYSYTVEETMGCPYCMDEEDDAFLQKLNKGSDVALSEDHFEEIMARLEVITDKQLPNLSVDPSQLPDFDAFQSLLPTDDPLLNEPQIEKVFEHWHARRAKRAGQAVFPVLKYVDVLKNEVDPYVCFRRRESKAVRKTRKTDQTSVNSLYHLQSKLEDARTLLEMVLRREKLFRESLALEQTIFNKKIKYREYQRILGIKEDDDLSLEPVKKKRRPNDSTTTIKIPLAKLKQEKTPLQQAIDAELLRRKEQDAGYEDITNRSYQPFASRVPDLFFHALVPSDVHVRKRVGRNGRVFLDRRSFRPKNNGGRSRGRFQFDSDHSDSDEDFEANWMSSSSVLHRVQQVSEMELRLLNVPPPNRVPPPPAAQQARPPQPQQVPQQPSSQAQSQQQGS
ncbi:enhancer of polycomb-like-domain-containing protein [Gongronella butleri]|nr:enhancer of polycomb-like-domain-containing protein [Gongronella butleri]